jgi:hypothetical protein
MSRIERFFHLRTFGTTGGATVRVVGNTDIVGQVDVQVAFCHSGPPNKKGDPYCRKTGRDTASAQPIKVVTLRYLPKELERIQAEVFRRSYGRAHAIPQQDFSFAVKYFLPKE